MRRAGDQVEVNVQLIDAESGAHVWADRFETNRRNLAGAKSEITGRLTRTLNLELVQDAGRRIEQEKAVDPDVRDLVMRGWALLYRPQSAVTFRKAKGAFEQALEIDPRSVDARIGIASALVNVVFGGWSSSVPQDQARAEDLLLEALERDANRSDVHATMGLLRRQQNRLVESRIEWETAIALDRNNATAIRNLGITLMYLGQPEAAILQIDKGMQVSPYDYNTPVANWSLGLSHLLLGRWMKTSTFLERPAAPILVSVISILAWPRRSGSRETLRTRAPLLPRGSSSDRSSTRWQHGEPIVPGRPILSSRRSPRKRCMSACTEPVSPTNERHPRHLFFASDRK